MAPNYLVEQVIRYEPETQEDNLPKSTVNNKVRNTKNITRM